MEFQEILYSKEEGIATITLNRPQSMNAYTPRTANELVRAFEEAGKDPEVRVAVLTGAGRAFCAGANPRALTPSGMDSTEGTGTLLRWGPFLRLHWALGHFEKPLIGSINGPAAGGGMDLANRCDIRIASEKAKFGMTYVRMGRIPADGGCYYLPRILGPSRAAELIWTGRVIDAQEALAIGYVSRVVPHEELGAATKDLASRLARGPAVAMQLSKRLLHRCLDLDLEAALEAHEAAMLIAQGTEDAKEGPRAWVEKREPIFKGR